ncbi:MAG TPA: prephenate dehydrogenase [Thermoanaerobaculia bacterium]|nr:prephenate dehydrogenase [Thermoanaerobaculia bacterium]
MRGSRDPGLGTRTRDRSVVAIIGLGLIGGSLARALRRRFPRRALIGVETNARARALARASGIFDAILPRPTETLRGCGIVVLCAPVPAILRLLGPVSRQMRDGAILTDVGGVKVPIADAARRAVRKGVSFVGAHPMFGGEQGGFAFSRPDLWNGGRVAVCIEGGERAALARVARLHRDLGARIVLCSSAEHDAAVAAVSHLPYVVANALALTARDSGALARVLAGPGFTDATRLAGFAFEVQGRAAASNRCLDKAIRLFRRHLTRLDREIRRPSGGALFDRASAIRRALVRNVAPRRRSS